MDVSNDSLFSRERSRTVSRAVEAKVLSSYGNGVFVPHTFNDYEGEESKYVSNPDSEVVLSSMNLIQSIPFLDDFKIPLEGRTISTGNSGSSKVIRDIRITVPHRMPNKDIPPPHPSMTKNVLQQYIWPGAYANQASHSYVGRVWLGLSEPAGISDIDSDQLNDGSFSTTSTSSTNMDWYTILDWPVMVGSNKCNYNIMRSYIGNYDTMTDPDTGNDTTYDARARYIIEDMFKCELSVPDGYFVINGRMKKVSVIDKLQMNMIYTIKSKLDEAKKKDDRVKPVGGIISEVRSVHPIYGLTYVRVFLAVPPKESKSEKQSYISSLYGSDIRIFIGGVLGRYSGGNSMDEVYNIFDIANIYASRLDDTPDIGADFLRNEILTLCGDDQDILRAVDITYERRDRSISNDTNINGYIYPICKDKELDVQTYKAMELDSLHRIFPHCEDILDIGYTDVIQWTSHSQLDDEAKASKRKAYYEVFKRKMRVLAMMTVNLVLSVTERIPLSERKDFSYKRWSTVGYELREYLRRMLSTITTLDKVGTDNIVAGLRVNVLSKYRAGKRSAKSSGGAEGFVEDVAKWNTISMLDSIRLVKISAPDEAGANAGQTRRIHTSQWGTQCPVNTPEGKNIGLNNSIAEVCLISVELSTDETRVIIDLIDNMADYDDQDDKCLLVLDGTPMKYVDPNEYDTLIDMRRKGKINRQVCISKHKYLPTIDESTLDVIVIRTSQGRPIFPVFILDGTLDRIEDIEEVSQDEELTMDKLMDDGYVEFLDSYELTHNCVVATWLYEAAKNVSKYTHSMIKPTHIASQATNCLSFYEHNPAARGTYASTHIKQAISRPFKYESDRFDHETNYLRKPEKPILSTDTGRRIGIANTGYGNNIRIAAMPHFGNVDDGIHFSESLFRSGRFAGVHYNVPSYRDDRGISANDKYNYILNEDKTGFITYSSPDGNTYNMPDYMYSNSIIIPYDKTYEEVLKYDEFIHRCNLPSTDTEHIRKVSLTRTRVYKEDNVRKEAMETDTYYEIGQGKLYRKSGIHMDTYAKYIISTPTGEVPYYPPGKEIHGDSVAIKLGEQQLELPGRTLVSTPIKYMLEHILSDPKIDVYLGKYNITYDVINNNVDPLERNLLSYIADIPELATVLPTLRGLVMAKLNEFKYVHLSLSYVSPNVKNTLNTPYVSNVQEVLTDKITGKVDVYYGPPSAPVSLYHTLAKTTSTNAELFYIYRKREVKRGDNAIKTIHHTSGIYNIQKEKFEITFGTMEGIGGYGTIKIKAGMPIYPKVGNKYAALYSQKSVCARIVPDNEMPVAEWKNPITGEVEVMRFDAVFNPLSFPSRGTIGMEYEMFIAGTVDYIYGLRVYDLVTDEDGDSIDVNDDVLNELIADVEDDDTLTLRDLYTRSTDDVGIEMRTKFDRIMDHRYDVENASDLLDELTDTTAFMYDDVERKRKAMELRKRVGIPTDGTYTCYLPDTEYEAYVNETIDTIMKKTYMDHTLQEIYDENLTKFDKVVRLCYGIDNAHKVVDELKHPNRSGITPNASSLVARKKLVNDVRTKVGLPINYTLSTDTNAGALTCIETPIACGTVYYVALRHLVDNKRRARGYVGKKDPLTLQPVKGRRRDGGANTGTMENDAAKSHGASAMAYERLALTSDYKILLRCPIPMCGGLVSPPNAITSGYKCVDCGTISDASQIIRHETVNSWNLFRMYCRALGVELYEEFDIDYIDRILSYIKSKGIDYVRKRGSKYVHIPTSNIYIYFDDSEFFTSDRLIHQAASETTKHINNNQRIIRVSYKFIYESDWMTRIIEYIESGKQIIFATGGEYTPRIQGILGMVL